MKNYEVNLSVDFGTKYGSEHFRDEWRFKTVEASDEHEAVKKAKEHFTNKGFGVNYILSCTPL